MAGSQPWKQEPQKSFDFDWGKDVEKVLGPDLRIRNAKFFSIGLGLVKVDFEDDEMMSLCWRFKWGGNQ